jgi:DNA-directed RNA polymerase specialized sigma24 family protein
VNSFRNDYATCKDFCAAFEREMDRFYLLAFLLAGNHASAEESFVRVMHSAPADRVVLKQYVRSWIRRSLIKDAISIVFEQAVRPPVKRDPWFEDASGKDAIEQLAELPDLERFVYVMSVLEGYSTKQCSVLLSRGLESVNVAKERALTEIGATPSFPLQLTESLRAIA